MTAKTAPFLGVGNQRGRTGFLINLGLVAVSLCVGLAGAEIGLRLAGYSAPLFRRPDPVLGWTLAPGVAGMHRKECKNFLRINDRGFNDAPRTVPKPRGTFRVAVLGDSFTEAAEVPRQKNFCSLTEQALADRPVPGWDRIEDLNFGVVGYGLSQQLLQLRKTVWAYDPDLVVVALYLGNDISDDDYRLAESIRDARPYFELREGRLTPEEGFPKRSRLRKDGLVTAVVNASRVMQLLKEAALRRSGGIKAGPAAPVPGKNDGVFRPPETREWAEAWAVSEELLRQTSREVKDRGKPFLVMTIPHPVRVHPDLKVRRAFARQLGVEDLDYPDRRIADLARRNGIPLLRLAPELGRLAEKTGVFFHGFDEGSYGTGHWNEKGHAHVARLLSERLRQMIEDPQTEERSPAGPELSFERMKRDDE